jgi:hypothetical protein
MRLAAFFCALALSCTAFAGKPQEREIAKESQLYDNPAQGSTPGGAKLAKGTKVEVLEKQGSYVKVRLADGKIGYVAESALK